VSTDKSSYTIPYGIAPEVSIGDTLTVGQELVKIAEVKDYKVEDEWWINLNIPVELIPEIGDGSKLLASPGSLSDTLMRDYLKYHTFLVRLKWDKAFTSNSFDEIFRILQDVKPKYTYPIFVWSIVDTDILSTEDDELQYNVDYALTDSFGCGGAYIQRYLERYYERSTACFIHGNMDPDEITNPLSVVTISYKIKAANVFNEVSPAAEELLDTDLVPLYNTGELDVRNSFLEAGISLPAFLPRVFLVKNVPITSTTYNALIVREPVDSGFTGVRFNSTLLDFPSDVYHHIYQAFVPLQTDLNATEDFFVMEIQSNLYTMLLYRPGETPIFLPPFFPREEEDPLSVYNVDLSVDQFTYDLGSPEVTLSNNNFTVSR
jgi:hypothetical protein